MYQSHEASGSASVVHFGSAYSCPQDVQHRAVGAWLADGAGLTVALAFMLRAGASLPPPPPPPPPSKSVRRLRGEAWPVGLGALMR